MMTKKYCNFHGNIFDYWNGNYWKQGPYEIVEKDKCEECIWRKSDECQKIMEELVKLFDKN